MIKNCEKCCKQYASWTVTQRFCKSCKRRDRYLRHARCFTDAEVVADLASKGRVGVPAPRMERRYDVAILAVDTGRWMLIKHMSKYPGGAHLVARGDTTGALKYIPTCRAQCIGCPKCAMASELNGETPSEARARRADPRGKWHKKYRLKGKEQKILLSREEKACATSEVDVYSQVEDID